MNQLTHNKPKIVQPFFQSISICLLISIWLVTTLTIVKSEGRIPSHFKLDGTIDRYSDNWSLLLILPMLGTGMYFIMLVLIRVLPRLLKFSTSITEPTSDGKLYAIKSILKGFQLLFLCQIFSIILSTFLLTTGRIQKIPEFLFPAFLITVGLMIIWLILVAIVNIKN